MRVVCYLLNRPRQPSSQGFDAVSYRTAPPNRYQLNRQLAGWNPPPQVFRTFEAHQRRKRKSQVHRHLCRDYRTLAVARPPTADTNRGGVRVGERCNFSRSGKPTDNAYIESFNGKFRAECLNANWFMSVDDAKEKCEAWRRDYNEVRPHSAIGNKPPVTLIERSAGNGPCRPEQAGESSSG